MIEKRQAQRCWHVFYRCCEWQKEGEQGRLKRHPAVGGGEKEEEEKKWWRRGRTWPCCVGTSACCGCGFGLSSVCVVRTSKSGMDGKGSNGENSGDRSRSSGARHGGPHCPASRFLFGIYLFSNTHTHTYKTQRKSVLNANFLLFLVYLSDKLSIVFLRCLL